MVHPRRNFFPGGFQIGPEEPLLADDIKLDHRTFDVILNEQVPHSDLPEMFQRRGKTFLRCHGGNVSLLDGMDVPALQPKTIRESMQLIRSRVVKLDQVAWRHGNSGLNKPLHQELSITISNRLRGIDHLASVAAPLIHDAQYAIRLRHGQYYVRPMRGAIE